jgi:L-ascorbate metabolism protein UlaG (beta-lactamase superfamily)
MMAHSTPIELPAPAPRVVSTGAGELYFIGNATTLITYAGFTLLTDPAFMHKGDYTPLGHGLYTRREIEPACGPQDLPPLDLLILSHYHGDHFDEVAAQELDKQLPIVTNGHAAEQLAQLGFTNLHPIDTWEAQAVRKGDAELLVTAMLAQHAPDPVIHLLPPVMGSMVEFSRGGRHLFRLYISGDTLLHDRLHDIPRRYPEIDLGLFHVGGTTILGVLVTMSGERGVHAVEIIHPRVAIPIHFNDYSVFLSGLGAFRAAATGASHTLATRVHYLRHGDTYRFSAEHGPVGIDQGEAPPVRIP